MFKTTYNTTYEWPKGTRDGIKKWTRDRNDTGLENIERTPPIYRNSETLTQIPKECLTPFNYSLKPKPIIQTNPYQSFSSSEVQKRDDDLLVRSTRPRVYKAPEISLDDIDDSGIREKIIDFTYSTTWGEASRDALPHTTKRFVPDSTWEIPYHVLFNKKEASIDKIECETSTLEDMKKWDKNQTRALSDPTFQFWYHFKNNKPVKLFDQSAIDIRSPEYTNKILSLAKEKKLRFPYKLRPPNYTGFMPEFPMKINPEKQDLEFSDTMITVSQLANRWCEQ